MPDPQTAPVTGLSIADKAEEVRVTMNGKAYKWGGKTTAGFDCSGYVSHVLNALFTGSSYTMSASEFASSNRFDTVTNPAAGDIICFPAAGGLPAHVGIVHDSTGWIGSQSSTGVAKVKFGNSYWARRTHSFRRLKAATTSAPVLSPARGA